MKTTIERLIKNNLFFIEALKELKNNPKVKAICSPEGVVLILDENDNLLPDPNISGKNKKTMFSYNSYTERKWKTLSSEIVKTEPEKFEILKYVITAEIKGKPLKYLGANSCWVNLKKCYLFETLSAAKEMLSSDAFRKEKISREGMILPPLSIHNATGVCISCSIGGVIISIFPILMGNVISKEHIIAEIKKPTGFKYD